MSTNNFPQDAAIKHAEQPKNVVFTLDSMHTKKAAPRRANARGHGTKGVGLPVQHEHSTRGVD